MGSVYISGHGGFFATSEQTFVPAGTKVVFHADPGAILVGSAGLRVLQLQPSGGTEEYVGTDDGSALGPMVPNYHLDSMRDIEIALERVVAAEDGSPIQWVGPDIRGGIRLCETPDHCLEERSHSCNGIFGLFDEQDVIHIVACRVDEDESTWPVTWGVPDDTDDEFLSRHTAAKEYMLEALQRDADSAWLYWEQLSEESRAYMLSQSKALKVAWEIRSARYVLSNEGRFALFKYFRSQDPESKHAIRSDTHLTEALQIIEDYITAFMNPEMDDQARALKFESLSPAAQAKFADITSEVAAWYNRYTCG